MNIVYVSKGELPPYFDMCPELKFTYNGIRKSVIELNNEMSSKEWTQFIKNFEDKKNKSYFKIRY